MISSIVSSESESSAMPMLAVTWNFSPFSAVNESLESSARNFSAGTTAFTALVAGRITVNSSPP